MMAIPEKLQTWVNEMRSKGLSEAALSALEADWTKKDVADEFARTVLAVPDYSRQTQDLKKRSDELAEKEAGLQNYLNELSKWKEDREIDLRKSSDEAKAFKAQRDQIKAQLDQIAVEQRNLYEQGLSSVNPDLIMNSNPANNSVNNMPTQDNPSYLTQDKLNEILRQREQETIRLQALQGSIIQQHYKLFGDIPDTAALIDKAMKSGKSLEDTWKAEYKVDEKKHNLEEEAINKRIEEEVAKRMTTAQSEAAIKGATFRQGDGGSPVLGLFLNKKQDGGAPLSVASDSDAHSAAVDSAISAWREGKYRSNA